MTDPGDEINQSPWTSGLVPLTWYDSDKYDEIRAMMSDGQAFASTYDKWRTYAENVEAFFGAKGIPTVRVPVCPHEFAQWCRARRSTPDAKARLAFGEWVAGNRTLTTARP